MISKNFIKNSFIYTVAGALPMASAVILLPLYIQYLETEVYGALAVCLVFASLIQIIVTYSFDTSLYIHYHELKNDKARLATFISSSFFFMIGLAIAVGVLLSVSGQILFTVIPQFDKISFYPYGFVAVGVGIVQAIFKVHGNLLQTREKPEPFLWSNVACFVIIAVTSVLGLKWFPNSLIGPLGGRLLAGAIMSAWALWRVFREFGIHFKMPWETVSFSFNAYTFVYQLQQWAMNSLDRVLILFLMPAAALATTGLYDFAIKCLVPVDLLLNGLNASLSPKVVKLIGINPVKESSPTINRYYYGLVSAIVLTICLSIFAIPIAVDLFAESTDYAKALQYIPYVGVIYVFKAVRLYFVVPFTVLKKMKRLTVLNFVVNVVKIVLMVLFITRWDLYGVIASAVLAFAFEIFLLWYFLRADYKVSFNGFKLIVAPFLMVLIIVVTEPLIGTQWPVLTHLFYGIIAVALLWFAYRNELRTLDPFKFLR